MSNVAKKYKNEYSIKFPVKSITCSSVVGCVQLTTVSLRMLGVVHAEVPPVAVERQDGADAVLGVDVDVARFRQRQVQDLFEPGEPYRTRRHNLSEACL